MDPVAIAIVAVLAGVLLLVYSVAIIQLMFQAGAMELAIASIVGLFCSGVGVFISMAWAYTHGTAHPRAAISVFGQTVELKKAPLYMLVIMACQAVAVAALLF